MNSQLWVISILAGGLVGYDVFDASIELRDFTCFRGADAPIGNEAVEPWCLFDDEAAAGATAR
jgi:hypothetical protein